jgi:limonene-1,2-epoxide hydrolase
MADNRDENEIRQLSKPSPTDVVREWVRRFNEANVEKLIALYAPDAVNHQVVTEPLVGREAIRKLFETEFARAEMACIQESLFESGDWAILEWSDPNGLRGCGFFHVVNGQIVFQRGYFDQLTFFKLQGLPVPKSYLANKSSEED